MKLKMKNTKDSLKKELTKDADKIVAKEEKVAATLFNKTVDAVALPKIQTTGSNPSLETIQTYLKLEVENIIKRYIPDLHDKVKLAVDSLIAKEFSRSVVIENKVIQAKDFKVEMLNKELKGWVLKFTSKDIGDPSKSYLAFQKVTW